MDLKEKNVIYSGGFGGIGLACVREFLKSGVKYMTIFDLDENKTAMLDFRKSYPGATIDFTPVDMMKKESIMAAFKSAVEKMGHFDVLVNGCGIMMDSQVDLTMGINLLGVIHSTLTALPYMDKSKGGRGGTIVNISSVAGLETPSLYAIYTTSKHGVTAFTRCMGDKIYYDRFGVSFLTICPGLTETSIVKDIHSRVTFKVFEENAKVFVHAKQQSAEVCAKNMIKVIETGRNSGVYLLDLGNIQEVTFPKIWEPEFEAP